MLKPLEVIVIYDDTINPPSPKMVACIESDEGWYYRINTNQWWRPAVKILKMNHSFLKHDSYLECGDPLMIGDYTVEKALKRGIIGTIHFSLIPEIITCLNEARSLRPNDKHLILKALSS